jgi:hypothetical protein
MLFCIGFEVTGSLVSRTTLLSTLDMTDGPGNGLLWDGWGASDTAAEKGRIFRVTIEPVQA